MRKKFNPDKKVRSNAAIGEKESAASFMQYLLEVSYPGGLMENSAHPAVDQKLHDVEFPSLPDSLFTKVPVFLQKVVAKSTSREERDLLFLGALVSLSSCLTKISGNYHGFNVFPNLYLYINSNSSLGKASLGRCKQLVSPVHDAILEECGVMMEKYKSEVKIFNKQEVKDYAKMPEKPRVKQLLIPASSNSTPFLRQLADNEGIGLVFETEFESIAKALKNDFGRYTDGFRKGFYNDTFSYYRERNREYREIKSPRLAVSLLGSFKQLSKLIPSTDDSLVHRFLFYCMNPGTEWKEVLSPERDHSMDRYFDELGQEFLAFYTALNQHPDMSLLFNDDQIEKFTYFFTQLQERYLVMQDSEFVATIGSLGLIFFRISMIFTVLRIMETGDYSQEKGCLDADFKASLSMVRVMVKHADYVYSYLS